MIDPVARALTLRTLGSVAGIIPERQQVKDCDSMNWDLCPLLFMNYKLKN